jgi:hypothetical protein
MLPPLLEAVGELEVRLLPYTGSEDCKEGMQLHWQSHLPREGC